MKGESEFRKRLRKEMEEVSSILGIEDPFSLDDEMKKLNDSEQIIKFIEEKTLNLEGEDKDRASSFLKTRISAVMEEGKGRPDTERR